MSSLFDWSPSWDRLEACSIPWLHLFSRLIEKLKSRQAIGLEIADLSTLVRNDLPVAQEWKFAVDQLVPRIYWCLRVSVVPGLSEGVLKQVAFFVTVVLCRVLQTQNVPIHLDQLEMVNVIADLLSHVAVSSAVHASTVMGGPLPYGCPVTSLPELQAKRVAIMNAVTFFGFSDNEALVYLARCLEGSAMTNELFACRAGSVTEAIDALLMSTRAAPSVAPPAAKAPASPVVSAIPLVTSPAPLASAPSEAEAEVMMKLLSEFKANFVPENSVIHRPEAAANVAAAVAAKEQQKEPTANEGGASPGIRQEEGESVMEYLRRYQRLMKTVATTAVCQQFVELGTCFLGDRCEKRHPLK
jgi:hypothetical protein